MNLWSYGLQDQLFSGNAMFVFMLWRWRWQVPLKYW